MLLHTKEDQWYHRGNIKTYQVKYKNSVGTINYAVFFPGWSKLCNIVAEVKNPNAFHRGVILRTRFSSGSSPGWIQPRYWVITAAFGVIFVTGGKIFYWIVLRQEMVGNNVYQTNLLPASSTTPIPPPLRYYAKRLGFAPCFLSFLKSMGKFPITYFKNYSRISTQCVLNRKRESGIR